MHDSFQWLCTVQLCTASLAVMEDNVQSWEFVFFKQTKTMTSGD